MNFCIPRLHLTFLALLLSNCKSVHAPVPGSGLQSRDRIAGHAVLQGDRGTYVMTPGCKETEPPQQPSPPAGSLRFMTYNVQNLFDLTHDIEGGVDKDDLEFLPRLQDRYGDPATVRWKESCCNAALYAAQIRNLRTAAQAANLRVAAADLSCQERESHNRSVMDTLRNAVSAEEMSEASAAGEKEYRSCADSDWSREKLDAHVRLLAEAVKVHLEQIPDILVLTEVENYNALNQFAAALGYVSPLTPTPNQGYDSAAARSLPGSGVRDVKSYSCRRNPAGFPNILMTTSPDERGIDVAILLRETPELQIVACLEHEVDIGFPTRNILEVQLRFQGQDLIVFGNHWPSQRGGRSSGPRVAAAQALHGLIRDRTNAAIIATGDFNITDYDEPNPFDTVLLAGNPDMFDLEAETSLPSFPGSYYFPPKAQWNHFDRLFYNRSLHSTGPLRIDPSSYTVHRRSPMAAPSVITAFREREDYERERFDSHNYATTWIGPQPPEADAGSSMYVSHPEVLQLFADNPSLKQLEITEHCAPSTYKTYNYETRQEELSGYSDHFGVSALITKVQ